MFYEFNNPKEVPLEETWNLADIFPSDEEWETGTRFLVPDKFVYRFIIIIWLVRSTCPSVPFS
jgi:hypothetical protein